MTRLDLDVAAAESLLGCRAGVQRAEVQTAYRRTLLRGRPDLGTADGEWTVRVQAARDLLLTWCPPERRRSRRREQGAGESWVPRRRATWGYTRQPGGIVDVRL
ncbi:MAG: hypothetical protein M3P95_03285 [Actinomycetota bacterium]|nr:hypothetical protein [Actinomycetota bacterium]